MIDKDKAIEAQRVAVVPPCLGLFQIDLLHVDQLRELFDERDQYKADAERFVKLANCVAIHNDAVRLTTADEWRTYLDAGR